MYKKAADLPISCRGPSPRKLIASLPLENDGTGRRSYPFEMGTCEFSDILIIRFLGGG